MQNLISKSEKCRPRQGLGETISELMFCVHLAKLDRRVMDKLVEEPQPDCEMLRGFGTKKTVPHVNTGNVVLENSEWPPGLADARLLT